jgi:hypothetical protein
LTSKTEFGFGAGLFPLFGMGYRVCLGLLPEVFFFAAGIFFWNAEGFLKRFTRERKSFFQGS